MVTRILVELTQDRKGSTKEEVREKGTVQGLTSNIRSPFITPLSVLFQASFICKASDVTPTRAVLPRVRSPRLVAATCSHLLRVFVLFHHM